MNTFTRSVDCAGRVARLNIYFSLTCLSSTFFVDLLYLLIFVTIKDIFVLNVLSVLNQIFIRLLIIFLIILVVV